MKSYHLRHSASHNTSTWYFFIISLLLCRCSYENPIHKVRPGKTSELLASLRKSLRYYELNLSGVKQAKTQTKNKESVDEDKEDWISRKFYKAMDASVIAKDQEKRLRGSELDPDRAFETLFKRMGVTEKQLTPELDLRTTNVVPSISNQHKIYSKNNLLVEILKNGVVRGSVWKRQSNDKTLLKILMLGRQLIIIKSSMYNLYLAMKSDSSIVAIDKPTIETVFFVEGTDDHNYVSFSSLFYRKGRRGKVRQRRKWYLGFKRNGMVKKGNKAEVDGKVRKSSKFLVQPQKTCDGKIDPCGKSGWT